MVEMAVCQKNLGGMQLIVRYKILQPLQLAVPVTTRIDEYARPRFIPRHITALPDRIEIESLYLHKNFFKHTNLRKDVVIL